MSGIKEPGWKKILTQVDAGLWARVKLRCFREAIPPCDGVNRALLAWVQAETPEEPPGVVPQRGEWF